MIINILHTSGFGCRLDCGTTFRIMRVRFLIIFVITITDLQWMQSVTYLIWCSCIGYVYASRYRVMRVIEVTQHIVNEAATWRRSSHLCLGIHCIFFCTYSGAGSRKRARATRMALLSHKYDEVESRFRRGIYFNNGGP